MNSFLAIFQGIPIILLISFIFGGVALIRIYLMHSPGIRRISIQDRRQSLTEPSFPFHDANNKVVSGERRKMINRRLASHVIVDYCVIH